MGKGEIARYEQFLLLPQCLKTKNKKNKKKQKKKNQKNCTALA